MKLKDIQSLGERVKGNISKVIVGKDELIDLILVSLFCSGHVLLDDVPGVGKTMLAKCLAKSVDCSFKRIQFTPDLLPSDLTGINYFNQKLSEFIFRQGPVFANFVLADEINRATPRTQSSLMECMEERQVTIDGETKEMERPFFIIATQNPVETQGTFPLPEAQLDRFFMRLRPGYPTRQEGVEILNRFQDAAVFPELGCVASAEEIVDAQNSFSKVKLSDELKSYIIDIVEMTRNYDRIIMGISPRGSLALMRAAQAAAVLKGRDFVTPDDVKHVAIPVLAHRLVLKGHAISTGVSSAEGMVLDILKRIPVPVEEH